MGLQFQNKEKLSGTKIKFYLLKTFKNPALMPMLKSNVKCVKKGFKVKKDKKKSIKVFKKYVLNRLVENLQSEEKKCSLLNYAFLLKFKNTL